MSKAAFHYEDAFSRNIGWLTRSEQQQLRDARIAIAGLGGVGGLHVLTLARLGVGAFSLAEFDRFEIENFNRQVGATCATVGESKLDVVERMAKEINPAIDIRRFPEGVTEANAEEFLSQADIYVDGLDFFAFDARILTFAACSRLGIPATTAAPLGMGVALLNFLPGRMTFQQYFGLDSCGDDERALRFLIGLSPAMLQRSYLVDASAVDLARQRGPSTSIACQLCAGVAAAETLKVVLGRGPVLTAPRGYQFDPYRNVFRRFWRPGGHRNPLSRLTLKLARRQLDSLQKQHGR